MRKSPKFSPEVIERAVRMVFDAKERQILDVLGDGPRTVPEIVKIIYADVMPALHRMAGMSVHSHLRKLRDEARASEETVAGSPSRWTLL
jgi:hypothetical protein